MRRHVELAIAHSRHGGEFEIIRSMRNRLMQYTRSIRGGKYLRQRFSQVGSLAEMEGIFAAYFAHQVELLDRGEGDEPENCEVGLAD